MGRSRGDQQLAAWRTADARRTPAQEVRREKCLGAGGARRSCISRIYAAALRAGRARPHLSQDFLWVAARRLHGYGPAAYFLGPTQIAWLKRELLSCWKVIAADMPIGLVVVYDTDRKWGVEAIAQGDGPPRGADLDTAAILSFIKRAPVPNTLWLTADVHCTAAHHYDPNKAVFQDFEPFWEFVSGRTFGPQIAYVKAPSAPNQPPSDGLQF